jgi:hypothetical protein
MAGAGSARTAVPAATAGDEGEGDTHENLTAAGWRSGASRRRLDELGVDLVGALGLDHVDQFLDDVDVRGFQLAACARCRDRRCRDCPPAAHPEAAVSTSMLLPLAWRPAGFMKRAVWILPSTVAAVCPCSCAETVPSAPTVICEAPSGTWICGCQRHAVGRDDRALRPKAEIAVARISDRAVRLRDLEEAAALDRHVERIVGLLDRALRIDARRAAIETPEPRLRPVAYLLSAEDGAPGAVID